jgi:hypothetical protein
MPDTNTTGTPVVDADHTQPVQTNTVAQHTDNVSGDGQQVLVLIPTDDIIQEGTEALSDRIETVVGQGSSSNATPDPNTDGDSTAITSITASSSILATGMADTRNAHNPVSNDISMSQTNKSGIEGHNLRNRNDLKRRLHDNDDAEHAASKRSKPSTSAKGSTRSAAVHGKTPNSRARQTPNKRTQAAVPGGEDVDMDDGAAAKIGEGSNDDSTRSEDGDHGPATDESNLLIRDERGGIQPDIATIGTDMAICDDNADILNGGRGVSEDPDPEDDDEMHGASSIIGEDSTVYVVEGIVDYRVRLVSA